MQPMTEDQFREMAADIWRDVQHANYPTEALELTVRRLRLLYSYGRLDGINEVADRLGERHEQ